MKSFTFCFIMLLMAMAAKTLAPTPSQGDTVDMDKLTQIVQELASRPVYEGPYEVVFDGTAATNDTDLSVSAGKTVRRYVNGFDSQFLFICPYGQSFSRISSHHSNHHEDRRFSVDCGASSSRSCSLSGYVNSFDHPFTYICPSNHVISGMGGYHSNHHEDRRWQYWCCRSSRSYSNCYWTNYVNYFDEYFDFRVPPVAYSLEFLRTTATITRIVASDSASAISSDVEVADGRMKTE